jgi:SOS-response transcriptional repressor LexA
MTDPTPMAGMTAFQRLKLQAEQRYVPQPLQIGGETFYFRRLDGPQLDALVAIQAKDAQISAVKYNAHVAAMAFVDDGGHTMTAEEAMKLGPHFVNPAAEFVLKLTGDYRDEEAATPSDEPAPFLVKPSIPSDSPAPSDAPALKSVSSRR